MDANRRKLEAVFLDLDGSLLNSRRQVGERDRRTIARLQQAGVRVYIATGRHYELSARHHRELGLTGPMLASDGAVLYHPVQRRVLYRHPIPPAVSRAAIQAAMDAGEEFYFHDTAAAYFSPNFGRIQVWRDYAAECGPEDLRPALGQLPPGYLEGEPEVMTFMAHRPSPAFVETLKRLCGETVPLYLSRDGMVAIATAPGWDKGRGAAFLAEQEGFSLDELAKAFDLAGMSKSPAIFDIEKLTHFNALYLRAMAPEDFAKAAEPYIRSTVKGEHLSAGEIAALLQARCEKLTDIPEKVAFFQELPEYSADLFTNKKSKTNPEVSKAMLEAAIPMLEGLDQWSQDAIHDGLVGLAERLEVKNATLMWPVRIAAAGQAVTPGGAVEICRILGKEETLRRLRLGLEKL